MSDLKKIRPAGKSIESSNSNNNNANNNYDSLDETRLNLQAPTFERVHRAGGLGGSSNSSDDDEERVCRICLEDDRPETMIAPCRCKGGSKWVHRDCLDEWRTVEKDRAFSKCTECQFEYHLQPIYGEDEYDTCRACAPCSNSCTPQRRRQLLFCWMVSRDAFVWILFQQLVVVLLAAVISECDPDRELPTLLLDPTWASPAAMVWLYYGLGWFAFLIMLGLYGSVAMCRNGCSFRRAIDVELGPPSSPSEDGDVEAGSAAGPPLSATATATATHSSSNSNSNQFRPNYSYQQVPMYRQPDRDSRASSLSSAEYYRRARRRRRHYHYYYYDPVWYPMYYYPGDSYDCCCWCCFSSHHRADSSDCCWPSGGGGGGIHSITRSSGSSGGGGSSSGNSDSNGGAHILLMILLVVAIVLAIIGFVVGVLVAVVVGHRIVQRHVHLLQKRQLVKEFKVVDLQGYDLDRPISSAPTPREVSGGAIGSSGGSLELAGTYRPPPSAPTMPAEDVQYLKKLGLIDGR